MDRYSSWKNRILSHLFFYWKREIYTILHDRGVFTLFIVVPLVYPVLYAYIYNQEVVREAPMVVVDRDQTHLSRELTHRIDGTADVEVVAVVSQVAEAMEGIYRHKASGYLVIPKGFSRNFYRGEQTQLELISDLSSMLSYKALMMGCNMASLQLGRDIQLQVLPSASQEMSLITVQPVPNEEIALFNRGTGYASFLLPMVLILVLQQTMLLGCGMLAGTYRERNAQNRLFSTLERKHALGVMRIVVGKSAAYLTLYAILAIWVLVFVPRIFDLPQLYFTGTVLLFMLSFLLACTYFSLFISCFIPNRESSIIYLAFSSVVFMFLTGIVWPTEAMPPFWSTVAEAIPSTPASKAFVALVSMGGDYQIIRPYLTTLWLQTLVYFILSSLSYVYILKRR